MALFATSRGSRAGNRSVSFRIGAKTVRALQRGLRQAHFARIPSGAYPSTCADCYSYAIRYRGHRVRLTEDEVPAALEPVLARLGAIVARHTIPPNV